MTGFCDKGDPCVEIEVANPLGWKKKLKCVIDTGFTGFLSIPLIEAFPIGLLLAGTMPVTLADGRTEYKLTCLGSAPVDGEAKVGTILIEPGSSQALLGTEFLVVFAKRLIVDPIAGIVEIVASSASSASQPRSEM